MTIDQSPMALSITGATKHYDSGFTLDDITFDLPAGYIMGLIGPNGAGKSTLIKLILNMIHRDAGEIHVFGLDNLADEETVKENLGVVFDCGYFIETWTVNKVEQTMAPMYLAWNRATFDNYLKRFGLDRKKRVKELSRGMQMKLMLAVALSHDAKLLVLDEPTSGLDVLARDELMDILQNYIADGERSVLFSTHITADLERAADFITYITRGKLYFTGPKDEFEESFRLVKGGPDDLTPDVKGVTVGIHRYETGFDALVRTEDIGKIEGLKVEEGKRRAPLAAEPASIDDIIRLTNTDEAAHAMEVA
ncbi:ABC transporter ATP-binding protein [Bifidobacterium sp. SO4]|uniref:ABC transporter ATP-binding protein n=1 Tax=Bifidobacterium sp. SO4 TaxID=2809030 RepID=UPI001BDBEA78|nr:ABC transporter ATP-binding protein [Bifidobacterium sp. SO4]MBT1171180.1 ABC transporter ATP-binding protein [Bifidobacterium sp. SO4]